MSPKERHSRKTFFLILFCLVFTSYAWAGEVVTKEIKSWAKGAMGEEKALKATPGKNTVAVLYFKNQTGQPEFDPLQKGMALLLITDLSKVKGLQVIERVQLQALVEELGLGTSGLVEPGTAPRVGKLLRAQWLVGGDISATKTLFEIKKIQLQSSVLDVSTEKILGQPSAEGERFELFRLEKEILFDLVKLMKIEISQAEEQQLRRPCSTNLTALMSLFKAVEASDRGDYSRAAELYEGALKEDDQICLAKEGLKEIQNLGLIAGKKKTREVLRSLRDQTSLTDQLTPEDADKRRKTPKEVPTPARIGIVFP